MSIVSILLFILLFLLLFGLGMLATTFFVGRKLFLSWKKPYRKGATSLQRLSHTSTPFLQEFVRHPLFYRWLQANGKHDEAAVAALVCAADDAVREEMFAVLPKQDKRYVHTAAKQKKKFTTEDVERTVAVVRTYIENEYENQGKKTDIGFYALYFYHEYGQALKFIEKHKRSVNSILQGTIDTIVASVLHSISYYRERNMYEQQHKFEAFLTKDLPEMLALISQLPSSQKHEKEKELTLFLKDFQQHIEESEDSMYSSLDYALNVKMRAAKEKFRKN